MNVSAFFCQHLRASVLHHSLERWTVRAELNSWLVLVVSCVLREVRWFSLAWYTEEEWLVAIPNLFPSSLGCKFREPSSSIKQRLIKFHVIHPLRDLFIGVDWNTWGLTFLCACVCAKDVLIEWVKEERLSVHEWAYINNALIISRDKKIDLVSVLQESAVVEQGWWRCMIDREPIKLICHVP